MADVTENDLLRYLRDEIADADERLRIEGAIYSDPIVGLRHDALLERPAPPSPASLGRRAEFARQEQAVHARIAFDRDANPAARTFRAKLSFANTLGVGQAVEIKGTAELKRLLIEFDRVPPGWEPVGIGMFTPRPIAPLVVRKGQRPQNTAEPASLVEQRESAVERARRAQIVEILAADTDCGVASLGEASNAFGAKVSIKHGLMNTGYLRYSFSAEYAPLGTARVKVECITDRERLEWASVFDLRADADGSYEGEIELERVTAEAIRRAVFLDLQVVPCGPIDCDSLTAAQFRDVVTHDFQMLVLHGRDSGEWQQYEAAFESDDERHRWADPAACQFVRFVQVESPAQV